MLQQMAYAARRPDRERGDEFASIADVTELVLKAYERLQADERRRVYCRRQVVLKTNNRSGCQAWLDHMYPDRPTHDEQQHLQIICRFCNQ